MTYQPANPFAGLPENLVPNPPPGMPEAPGPGDAMKTLSPFRKALDVDEIIKNLILDRPLKLYIPDVQKYPEFEFRIINDIPSERAQAHNKGYREVDLPELVEAFNGLIAGSDKNGKPYAPLLMARPRAVSREIIKRQRRQLHSIYAGMDPANKEFNSSKYTKNAGALGGSEGSFSGAGFRIRV